MILLLLFISLLNGCKQHSSIQSNKSNTRTTTLQQIITAKSNGMDIEFTLDNPSKKSYCHYKDGRSLESTYTCRFFNSVSEAQKNGHYKICNDLQDESCQISQLLQCGNSNSSITPPLYILMGCYSMVDKDSSLFMPKSDSSDVSVTGELTSTAITNNKSDLLERTLYSFLPPGTDPSVPVCMDADRPYDLNYIFTKRPALSKNAQKATVNMHTWFSCINTYDSNTKVRDIPLKAAQQQYERNRVSGLASTSLPYDGVCPNNTYWELRNDGMCWEKNANMENTEPCTNTLSGTDLYVCRTKTLSTLQKSFQEYMDKNLKFDPNFVKPAEKQKGIF